MLYHAIPCLNLVGHLVNILENNYHLSLLLVTKDKLKTKGLLDKLNYPTTTTIDKNNVSISDYVVCKPINGKCGQGIYFFRPTKVVPAKYLEDNKYFCERFEEGQHYRIIMYHNEIISIIERIIPTVVGDGHQTVKKLVEVENTTRIAKNKILLSVEDKDYIPDVGEVVQCNNLCNFSTGGTAKIVNTDQVPIRTLRLFKRLSRDLQLNLFSIDLIASDITSTIGKQAVFCINELEYCNDWDINFLLKDNFSRLATILVLKWIIIMIIIWKVIIWIKSGR